MQIGFGREDAFESPAGILFELAFAVPLQGVRLEISDDCIKRMREDEFAPPRPRKILLSSEYARCIDRCHREAFVNMDFRPWLSADGLDKWHFGMR